MNFLITLIILLIILGVIVTIHEFGHFIAAKSFGVYVYEFSIGMGPKIYSFKRKNDDTVYSLRLFPIGGYVAMANVEADGEVKLKKDQILENKSYLKKLVVLFAGIIMNLVLAIVILFISGLIWGSPETKPYVGKVMEGYPAYEAGIEKGDLILKVDDKNIKSWDEIILELNEKEIKDTYVFTLEKPNGNIEKVNVHPKKITENEEDRYVFGVSASTDREYGFISAIKYTTNKLLGMLDSMANILGKLFTGKIGVDKLSGPVGMFTVIDDMKTSGIENILYLVAFLSVNVAVINLIPVPVFDGGRILLITIERIKGKKINPNIEGYLNMIGFALLVLLMVYVTINDVLKLF